MGKFKVLIADDEEGVRDLCTLIAEEEGYEVITASDGIEALQKVKQTIPDVVLLDVRMPEMDGMEVYQKMKEDLIDSPVIFVTAFGSSDLAIEAMKQGAYDYITKPFDVDEMRIVLRKALQLKQLTKELVTLRSKQTSFSTEDQLVGSSQVMQDVFKNIGLYAKNNASLLIEGETGTETEQVAKILHQKAFNGKGTFIEVACYGNEISFQQEIAKMKPMVDSTVYIKDIHLLTKECQALLLKKLMDTGGYRLISSAAKNIAEKVQEDSFHEELYTRISMVRILLPPLRERIEDLEEWCIYYLGQLNVQYSRHVKGYTPEAIHIMKKYEWPGNINELKNTIIHSMLSTKSNFIAKENLPTFLLHKSTEQKVDPSDIYEGLSLAEAVKCFEMDYIKRVLKIHQGSKTKTAQTLGISRRSLFNKMRTYDLPEDSS